MPKKAAKKSSKSTVTNARKVAKAAIQEKTVSRLESIAAVVAELRKKHGQAVVMDLTGGQNANLIKTLQHGVLPSGAFSLDAAMGVGGYPRGRIIEIYGPEAAGKSTLALHAVVECQRLGGIAAYVDAEHAMDLRYAQAVGVDISPNALIFTQPDYGEQGLDVALALIEGGADLVIVDSVAALTPKVEIEGNVGDTHVGVHSRLMSQAMRKFASVVSRTGATVIFINQLRSKIGVMYGSPEVTTGGNALKYYASVRIDVRRREQIKAADGKSIGNSTHIKIVKNKVAPPFQEIDLDLLWGRGLDRNADLLNVAVAQGVVVKTGAWYCFHDVRLGHGAANAINTLNNDADTAAQILEEVKKCFLIPA